MKCLILPLVIFALVVAEKKLLIIVWIQYHFLWLIACCLLIFLDFSLFFFDLLFIIQGNSWSMNDDMTQIWNVITYYTYLYYLWLHSVCSNIIKGTSHFQHFCFRDFCFSGFLFSVFWSTTKNKEKNKSIVFLIAC